MFYLHNLNNNRVLKVTRNLWTFVFKCYWIWPKKQSHYNYTIMSEVETATFSHGNPWNLAGINLIEIIESEFDKIK